MKLSTAINRLRKIKRQTICRMDQLTNRPGLNRKEIIAATLSGRRDIEAIDGIVALLKSTFVAAND